MNKSSSGFGIRGSRLASSRTFGLMLTFSSLALAEKPSTGGVEPNLTITVHVYNYAHVSRRTLMEAEKEAAQILRKAGVETEWVDCPVSPGTDQDYPACKSPFGPTGLLLKILPRFMAARLALGQNKLAVCPTSGEAVLGSEAVIAYGGIEDLADVWSADRPLFLGLTTAHEIGHLLLHRAIHSPTGLMRARWSPEDLLRATRGQLCFNNEQGAKMRADVRSRMAQQESTPSALLATQR
jgi:hypothetical protein